MASLTQHLFALLVLDLLVPRSAFALLPSAASTLVAAVFAGLPVFFSGLIFSRAFRDVQLPAQGLGVNLMGAVIGGVLENSVMIGGTTILGAMAIVIYAVSAVALRWKIVAPATATSSK